MIRNFRSVFLAFCLMAASSAPSLGAGFALYEYSARTNGLGGAVVANIGDPSTLATNPAGMTMLEGTQWMVGTTAIVPTTDIESPQYGVGTPPSDIWWPSHAYYTRQINDTTWVGVGLFSRFGLGSEIDTKWFGRYNNVMASIRSLSLNPSVAWKLSDTLSASLGVEFMWFEFEQRKMIDWQALATKTPPDPAHRADIESHILGDSTAFGFNIGLLWQMRPDLAFGLHYRSRMTQELEGDVSFVKPLLPAPFTIPEGFFPGTGVRGTITLPSSLALGIAWHISEATTIEVGGTWTEWSTYDKLEIQYGVPLVPGNPGSTVTSIPKMWRDAWRYQIGVETKIRPDLTLRFGYIRDESPVTPGHEDYLVPPGDRDVFCLGIGIERKDWSLDFSYLYLTMDDYDLTGRPAEGIYDASFRNGDGHVFGITYSWRL